MMVKVPLERSGRLRGRGSSRHGCGRVRRVLAASGDRDGASEALMNAVATADPRGGTRRPGRRR